MGKQKKNMIFNEKLNISLQTPLKNNKNTNFPLQKQRKT
jgi:hypothetical protein